VTLNNLHDVQLNTEKMKSAWVDQMKEILENSKARVKNKEDVFTLGAEDGGQVVQLVLADNLETILTNLEAKYNSNLDLCASLDDEIERQLSAMIHGVCLQLKVEVFVFLGVAMERVDKDLATGLIEAPEPLLDYLEENLIISNEKMYDQVMTLFVPAVYETVLQCFKGLLLPTMEIRAIPANITCVSSLEQRSVIPSVVKALYEYFEADGGGLTEAQLQIPLYHKIEDILLVISISDVGFLIASYYRRLAVCRPLLCHLNELEVAGTKVPSRLGMLKLATTVHIPPSYGKDRKYSVSVEVIEAMDLISMNNRNDESDPYIKVNVFPPSLNTSVSGPVKTNYIKKNRRNPKWNETFDFLLTGAPDDVVIVFSMFDREMLGRNKPMGEVAVLLSQTRERVEQTLPLTASVPNVEINQGTNDASIDGPSVTASEVYTMLDTRRDVSESDKHLLRHFQTKTKACYAQHSSLPTPKWNGI